MIKKITVSQYYNYSSVANLATSQTPLATWIVKSHEWQFKRFFRYFGECWHWHQDILTTKWCESTSRAHILNHEPMALWWMVWLWQRGGPAVAAHTSALLWGCKTNCVVSPTKTSLLIKCFTMHFYSIRNVSLQKVLKSCHFFFDYLLL